jgi:hypothetical protein
VVGRMEGWIMGRRWSDGGGFGVGVGEERWFAGVRSGFAGSERLGES